MAEQRKKSDSILLHTCGKKILLELFPADQWPEENGAEGLFRVRISAWPAQEGAERQSRGIWHCPAGKYSFLGKSAIGELAAALLNGGEPLQEEAAPYLPCGSEVSVYLDSAAFRQRGHVKVAPYQKRDGRWYAQVWIPGGVREFCCNDITLRQVRRQV